MASAVFDLCEGYVTAAAQLDPVWASMRGVAGDGGAAPRSSTGAFSGPGRRLGMLESSAMPAARVVIDLRLHLDLPLPPTEAARPSRGPCRSWRSPWSR